MATSITAIIMTKNEAHDIAACIESVLWMDRVIVLDSGSTDGTQDICKKYAVQLVEAPWLGSFGKQKNQALVLATTDWVFSLDADERITEPLKQEVLQIINGNPECTAYKIPRQNFFLNKKIKHCWNTKSDMPIKLLRRGMAKFDDALVHENVIAAEPIGKLTNALLHYPVRDLEEMLNKTNFYSTLGATKLAQKDIKSSIMKTLGHGIWAFIRIYILKLGFLDGWPGFLIALANFEGTFYRYAKLLEKENYELRITNYEL
jgi:glycosyltransferase involved in cell wall biosynthesis